MASSGMRPAGMGLILHLGAKVRDIPADGLKIADPAKLLKWLGRDRIKHV